MVWRSCSLFIVLTASLAVACGDDESTGTSLSGGASATAGSSSSSSGGEGSSSSSTGHSSSSSDGSSSTTATTDDSTSADSSNTTGSTTDNTTGTSGTTADPADCNNGVLDPGEQCDGQNIGDFTCEGLGYAGGTLSCDPVMCILDTSMCEMGDSTGSTGG